jgi:hypothetical protein
MLATLAGDLVGNLHFLELNNKSGYSRLLPTTQINTSMEIALDLTLEMLFLLMRLQLGLEKREVYRECSAERMNGITMTLKKTATARTAASNSTEPLSTIIKALVTPLLRR